MVGLVAWRSDTSIRALKEGVGDTPAPGTPQALMAIGDMRLSEAENAGRRRTFVATSGSVVQTPRTFGGVRT